MVLKSIQDVGMPNTLGKRKYSDIGVFTGLYSTKVDAFNTSKNIIESVKQYVEYLRKNSTTCNVMLGVDEDKLFYIDCIYLKIFPESTNFEIMINLKDSYNYKLLESMVNNPKGVDRRYFPLYESFWKDALSLAIKESGLIVKYLSWE